VTDAKEIAWSALLSIQWMVADVSVFGSRARLRAAQKLRGLAHVRRHGPQRWAVERASGERGLCIGLIEVDVGHRRLAVAVTRRDLGHALKVVA
jgi:hypothetical protein